MFKTLLDKGKIRKADVNEKHDYAFPSGSDFLSAATNLIPGVSGTSGGRVLLGDKASIQSVSLVHREAPLVQGITADGDTSFESKFGKLLGAKFSPVDGVISEVTENHISIKEPNGHVTTVELYHNFNSGKKSFLHHTPVVKVGDKVHKDQLLAPSNHTDKGGVLALGANLKTAIMPYRSNNFEDAFVVTQSGADKLKAEQMFTVRLERRLGVDTKKDTYISLFPNKFYNTQLTHIDSDGVIKKGTKVKYGDPIILAYAPKALKTTDIHLGKLSKALGNAYRDVTEVWDYETPGEVTDVAKAGDLLSVNIKTVRPLNIGDKISIGYGNKGVTGSILPDSLAPTTSDGKPVDIILNSMSITSRVSPALPAVLGIGKVALKTGKPISITPFVSGSLIKNTQELMKKHDVQDVEELYDPVSGTKINALVGPLFFNRLVHIAEDKISTRSQGVSYDWNCFKLDDRTEILTSRGWLTGDQISDTDQFCTQNKDGDIIFEKAEKIIKQHFTGKLYGYSSKYLSYLTTGNHRLYVTAGRKQNFTFKTAEELYNTSFYVNVGESKLRKVSSDKGHFTEDYEGTVWCVNMPTTGLIYVRRDKKPMWIGNSQPAKGDSTECLTPEHEVLTKTGWKYIDQLKAGEEVYSIDSKGNIHFNKIQTLNEHDYDGELYHIETNMTGLRATTGHNIYCTLNDKNNEFQLLPVSTLKDRYSYYLKKAGNLTQESNIVLSDYINDLYTRIPGSSGAPVKKITATNRTILYLAGLYLGDGERFWHEPSGNYGIAITQKKPETDKIIRRTLDKLNITYYFNETSKKYVIHGKTIALFAELFGTSSYTKRIPDWIFDFSKKELKALFNGMMITDGARSGDKYFTSSKQLSDDFQRLCLHLDMSATIKFKAGGYTVTFPNGITSVARDRYIVYISRQKNYPIVRNRGARKNTRFERYKGKVYCPTVENDHTFYVRLGGRCHWTGNSSKRLGNLSTTALLSHSSVNVLKDIATVRATRNDEFWRNIKLGLPAPAPKVPFIFNKFIASLQGAGIKVDRKDDKFQILPQTDKEVLKLSSGPVQNAKTFKVKGENLIPEKGGLFDPGSTGIFGNNFNHINLNFKVPNPISEDQLRRLFKMTKAAYEQAITSGELETKLNSLDVDAKIKEYKDYIKTGKVSDRANAVKVLAFLLTLKNNGIHPKELMLSKIPVIPAQYRPIQVAGGLTLSANANHLYKDIILNNDKIPDLQYAPEEIANKTKLSQYEAVKALYGLGDPISIKHKEKNVKGILAELLGTHGGSAKGSEFQAKVVNKPLDLIGRGVATGDVKLDLDNISIPQDLAWKIFSPFVVRRLVRKGVSAIQAHQFVKERNDLANSVLHEEMEDRPVIMSRDPALHKFNLMGFKPKINPDPKNKTISVNPLVFKGFNLDLDGDQVSVSTPANDDAKEEVKEKMLPSRNLLSIRSFTPLYVPSNESSLGLYQMSTENNNNKPIEFKSEAEVVAAHAAGKVSVGDRIVIKP